MGLRADDTLENQTYTEKVHQTGIVRGALWSLNGGSPEEKQTAATVGRPTEPNCGEASHT